MIAEKVDLRLSDIIVEILGECINECVIKEEDGSLVLTIPKDVFREKFIEKTTMPILDLLEDEEVLVKLCEKIENKTSIKTESKFIEDMDGYVYVFKKQN